MEVMEVSERNNQSDPLTNPLTQQKEKSEDTEEEQPQYFECESEKCQLREEYKYFGNMPPFAKKLKLLENAYIIEDPFQAPKQGEILILGAHCSLCGKSVCKSSQCSFYYGATYCIPCAKGKRHEFPKTIQEKLNKILC